jgi:outer membrane protein assembly factor BamA
LIVNVILLLILLLPASIHLQSKFFSLPVTKKNNRTRFFLLVVFVISKSISYSQVVEKAPTSPVTVIAAPIDSVNRLIEITDVIISGFKRTRPYVIEREMPFKRGDSIWSNDLPAKLSLCKQQLMNTTLFVDVDINTIKLDSTRVLLDVLVKERWYLFPIPYFRIVSRNFNTWWVEENHSLDRVEYGIKFMQNNFSGRNDNLNIWVLSGYTQQLSMRYENPNIDKKLKQGINFGFGYKRNRELNYIVDSNKQKFFKQPGQFITNQLYTDFSYTYRPAIRTRHTLKAAYLSLQVSDTVLKLNPRYFGSADTRVNFLELSYNLSYTYLDYNPYPLKGFAGEVALTKRFGKYSHFWQLSGRLNFNKKLARTTFAQLQGVGKIKLPFNQPYISNNMMGASDFYLRGLEYYVVEGVAGGIGRATIKNEILSLNVHNPLKSKTHDKIPFRVFIKTFGDVGYSYSKNLNYSRLNNRLLKTWGVGLDIVTFYDIVIRLEYSFNQLGDKALFFHTQNDW